MKLWHLLIGGLVLAAFSGCRTNGGQEWLEQEMRQLEDQVYLYQDQARRSQMQLDAARRENAALRKELDAKGAPGPAGAAPPAGMPGVNIEIPDGAPGALPAPPSVEAGPPEPPAAPGAKAPETLPEPSRSRVRALPEGEFKAPATMPAPPAASPEPPATLPEAPATAPKAPAEAPAAPATPDEQGPAILPVPAPGAAPRGDSARVNTLMINRLLTGGYSTDGKPGDQGVTAVVEPRDADGRLVNAAGPVSVVVIDPLLEGSRRRVGRWDFTAEQTATRFRQTALGQGLHLELPWPNRPPTNKHLKLYVRYQTRDGRKLIAQRDIDIDAPGRRPTATIADSTSSSVPRVAPGTAAPKTPTPAPTTSPTAKPSRAWTPAPAAAAKAGVDPQGKVPAAESPSWTPGRDDKPARSEATEPPRSTSQARRPEWRPYR